MSLRTAYTTLTKHESPSLRDLIARLESTKTLIVDEYFFMGCEDFDALSRNLMLARSTTEDSFGGLDIILSGDEFQLRPPVKTALFDKNLVASLTSDSSLQALSVSNRQNLTAFKTYRSFQHCIILDEVVRQKNPRFVELLARLRRGNCTISGNDNDLDYLRRFRLGSDDCLSDPSVIDITKWVYDKENAAPLITFTNSVKNAHNWAMSKAFANVTGSEFGVYYAEDANGRGRGRVVLTGQNAHDAWRTPGKQSAHDLAGRLPLVIGMPVFIVANIAVELGVANGSPGTLVAINYVIRDGRRYAISAVVDIPSYKPSDPDAPNARHVLICLETKKVIYVHSSNGRTYSAQRTQLPIVPGFAVTAHGSQSRSLNRGLLHLSSCANLAAVYVMISRIKCGVGEPVGLAIIGDIPVDKISCHASQEVRKEEKRLRALQANTLVMAKSKLSWYYDLVGSDD